MELKRTLLEHARALAAGEYSAEELTRAYLKRIEQNDAALGAYLTVDAEGALAAARASDERRRRGACLGELDGIPFALKDNVAARGLPLTCASRMLERYVSPFDATVTERLLQSGAVLLGKTNMDEFAMGSSTVYSALAKTKNPHDEEAVPGGSSGGSAAAVAAHEAAFALGTDTGGSVRQPAAFCGVYGFKPTYGSLSRYGAVAMASSLDCIGIMGHSASDCAAIFAAMIGKDVRDATCMDYSKQAFLSDLHAKDTVLRVAVIPALLAGGTEPDVRHATMKAVDLLKNLGAVVTEATLPLPDAALASYTVLCSAEAASNLGRYDGVHYGHRSQKSDSIGELYENSRAEGFGKEVIRRILFGTDMLLGENRARYYVRAQRMRECIRASMEELLSRYDLILTPTSPTVAFRYGETRDPELVRRSDLCTVYANLGGMPALSIPFGTDFQGLPVAVQLTAGRGREGLLLRVAERMEVARK